MITLFAALLLFGGLAYLLTKDEPTPPDQGVPA